MRLLGEKMFDQRIVEKTLINMLEKYDNVIAAVEQSKGLTKLSLEHLTVLLESHEKRD